MSAKRKMSEEDCQEEIETNREEFEKLVNDHAAEIKDIITNIAMVEKRISLEKLEICENNEKIEKLKQ